MVVLATSRKLVVIQLILVVQTKTLYQMKDIGHGYLLVDLIFETTSEKEEKFTFENSIFLGGVEVHTPLVLKGLRS